MKTWKTWTANKNTTKLCQDSVERGAVTSDCWTVTSSRCCSWWYLQFIDVVLRAGKKINFPGSDSYVPSVSAHVDDVISSSARSMYAIRVLRSHGMTELALQQVFRAVVISRLTYAAPAWRGFTTSSDCQRIDAVLRRANKSGLWKSAAPSDFLTFEDLCSSADEELFIKTSTFLPPLSTASQCYSLRQRTHSFQLPIHSTHL